MSQLDRALRKARGESVESSDAPPHVSREQAAGAVFRSPWNFETSMKAAPIAVPLDRTPTHRVSIERPETGPQFVGFRADLGPKLVAGDQASPFIREQFRKVAAWLYQLRESQPDTKVVMVVSAVPGEGKTLTAANLALTLSQPEYSSVLLVDADLRRPSLHKVFNLGHGPGLKDVLAGAAGGQLPSVRVSEQLHVLAAGGAAIDPMGGLASERMRETLAAAGRTFDWVILDTPPVDVISDAKVLAGLADTALLVVQAASTKCQAAKRAVDAIGRDRILGVVFNQVADPVANRKYSGYYGYYDEPAS